VPKYAIFNPFKRYHTLNIPEGVARYRGISPGAKLVYGRLYRYAGQRGVAFPAVDILAEEVGLGIRQTQTYIAELTAEDFINIRRQYRKGALFEFQDHPALSAGSIGAPRWGRFGVEPQDTAEPKPQSGTAGYCGSTAQDTAESLASAPIVYLRESLEEGQIPPTPFSQDQCQNQTAHRPILDEEFEDGEAVPRSKGRFPKRRIGNYQRAEKPHEKSDNIRRMRERNYEAAPSVTAPSNGHTNGHTTPAAATLPDFPARWNVLVPERPVDCDLMPKHPPAYQEPVFIKRFDEICQKARAEILAGSKMTLTFLLGSHKKTGQYFWQQLLAGDDMGWLNKKEKDKTQQHEDNLSSMRKALGL
jgi:hypothetical protein